MAIVKLDTEKLTFPLRKNGHLGDAIVTGAELTPKETNGIASDFYLADLLYSSDDHHLPSPDIAPPRDVYDRRYSRFTVDLRLFHLEVPWP